MATIIQLRNDTAANFTQYNPTLAEGECGLELDTRKIKVGDGIHTWNQLPYWTDASLIEKAVKYNGSTAVGSATQGTYVAADGTATAMTYELNKTVPSDAVFTDDSAIWGNINGTLSNQTDLQNALDGKVDELSNPATAGTYTKVTINSDGLVSSGTTLSASDIPDISSTYYLASNPAGYTDNVGTVTSVNNVEPVNGNVTIEIPDTATWGNIIGTLSNQTDLQSALDNKVDKTTTADRVYGTDANGDQTTYDKNSFGQVDDVTVGGTSVVTNKVAILGSMAGETASDYATAAQGALADSAVQDVQINNVSVTTGGVANIPVASNSAYGVVRVTPTSYGIGITTSTGDLYINHPTEAQIISKTNPNFAVTLDRLNIAIREGLGNNDLTWTDEYKENARNTIGATQAVFVDWSD